jgi:hypothetical protein
MAKRRKPAQVAASAKPAPVAASDSEPVFRLTYRQERFIDAYIDNGGNATRAYMTANPGVLHSSAGELGHRLLKNVEITAAIESRRTEIRESLAFNREKALRIYIGMVTATGADFARVLKDPENEDSYAGLGDKIHALEYAKASWKNGNEIKLVSKKAALDEIWEKLGLGKDTGSGNWFDGLESLAELVRGAKEKKR